VPLATGSRHCDSGPAAEVIDRAHLARMTFGEQSLARELLELFDRQAVTLLARLREGGAETAALAHTLKGSAGGIGAWRVMRAAENCERAAGGSAAAIDGLVLAVEEARAAIAEILAAD